MTSFLPLLAVLILLSGVNYDSTTEFALVVVDGYLGCKKGMEDTRRQIGCNLPLAVLFMNELPRALLPAYSDSSKDEPTSTNVSAVGLVAMAEDGCPLLTPMTKKATTSWYENRQLLAGSNDQIMKLWLVSSKLGNWVAYRAGILAQLTPQMALLSTADDLSEDSKGVCRSSDSSCAADTVNVAGCDAFHTCSLDVSGEEQIECPGNAAACEMKKFPLSLDVSRADSCKVSFIYAGNSFSTDMFMSDAEGRPSVLQGLKLLNISAANARKNFFTEAIRREQFEYMMKQEETTALEGHNVLFILLGLVFMCVQLCTTVAIVAYYHKSVLSKLKEILFLNKVSMDKFNESNESLTKLLMVTKSYIEVRDNELNEMQSLIKSLTAEKRQMQENIECLLNDQSMLRRSVDAMKQERDEAFKRELVFQNEVKRLDTYVEKLLLAVLSHHPELLQRQQ